MKFTSQLLQNKIIQLAKAKPNPLTGFGFTFHQLAHPVNQKDTGKDNSSNYKTQSVKMF